MLIYPLNQLRLDPCSFCHLLRNLLSSHEVYAHNRDIFTLVSPFFRDFLPYFSRLRLANDDDWQQKMQSSNALQYLNQVKPYP